VFTFAPKRAGDFVAGPKKRRSGGGGGGAAIGGGGAKLLIDLAKGNGAIEDPSIRQDLMKLHTLGELGRFNNLRLKAAKKAGQDIPGIGNLSKLAMSDIMRSTRDVGLRIIGAAGMLHAYTDDQRAAIEEATGSPFGQMVTSIALGPRGRRSTAAPTRSSATSSASVLGLPKVATRRTSVLRAAQERLSRAATSPASRVRP
jgi:hypothetical protein